MDKSSDCLYCQRNELQKSLMIEICDLKASTLFLFKEQSHPGRCVVAYKDHVKELFELSETDRNAFMEDVCRVAAAMQKAFSPAKINYGAYSDKLPHLHFHLVPKYEDGLSFGGTFEMNPQKTYLSEAEYTEITRKIVNAL
jgi:diadenosine tetraphosphate (Ap4A) HIT family hydrolase